MSRYFEFERKLGWSEAVAVAALITSGVSLWQSHAALSEARPVVSVKEDQVVAGPYLNPTLRRWQFFVYARFIVANRGGRATTLLGFEPSAAVPMVLSISGDAAKPAPDLLSKTLILSEMPDDIRAAPERLVGLRGLSPEELRLQNMQIESGAARVIILGLFFDAYDDSSREHTSHILLAFDLVFSDGYRYKFYGGFPVPPAPAEGGS